MKDCPECRGAGFWWKQTCKLELGAEFNEPEKIICPICKGTGKINDIDLCIPQQERTER